MFSLSKRQVLGHLGYQNADIGTLANLVSRGRLDLSRSISAIVPLEDVAKGIEKLDKADGDPIRILVSREPVTDLKRTASRLLTGASGGIGRPSGGDWPTRAATSACRTGATATMRGGRRLRSGARQAGRPSPPTCPIRERTARRWSTSADERTRPRRRTHRQRGSTPT